MHNRAYQPTHNVISTLIHSYPARLLFLVAAILAAVAIILLRTLFASGASPIRPNLYTNP